MEDKISNRPLYTYTSSLHLTFKAWPVIAAATIGLCYLTQTVAGWMGIELKEQAVIDQTRQTGLYCWQLLKTQGLHACLSDKIASTFIKNLPLILLLPPIAEEGIFRGILFRLPASRIKAPSWVLPLTILFAIISSALFSAAHYMQSPWPDNAFAALFAFGLAQCWLYQKTNSFWSPALNHGLFNLTNLILLFLLPSH